MKAPIVFLSASFALIAGLSVAQADMRFTPVENALAKKECSACHMAFQPAMLPKRSWEVMMNSLDNHFGEDASLDDASTQEILEYYGANAADQGWYSNKFLRGVSENAAPQRITELPYWVREHNHEVHPSSWTSDKVKTKANCLACHRRANAGDYDDD